jgi:hypothetical protein
MKQSAEQTKDCSGQIGEYTQATAGRLEVKEPDSWIGIISR